jgi:carboxyl-terminal processing protease
VRDRDAVDGVWRSRGYGWLWQIEEGRVTRFDVGDGFCIPTKSDERDSIDPKNQAQLSEDRGMLRLPQEDPDYLYSFERLSEPPASCKKSQDANPVAVFDVAVKMLEAHYAFFEQRKIDWPRLVDAARAKVGPMMTDAELLAVFSDLLTPFGDSHVGLEAEVDGNEESIWATDMRTRTQPGGQAAVSGAWNHWAAEALLGESAQRSDDGALVYGLLAEKIGYLQVRSMAGMEASELEATMDGAMSAFEGARAVLVDVSMNDGGLDSIARRIASRFATKPTIAYSKSAGDFVGDEPQEIILRPPDRPRYLGPVYLITSQATLSAAEIFTMSMRALPNVVHLGETTDGALSDQLWKTLPNGWRLSLSNEVYLDSDGVLWEGRGIPPEIPLAISNRRNVTEKDLRAVRDVLDYVEKQLN